MEIVVKLRQMESTMFLGEGKKGKLETVLCLSGQLVLRLRKWIFFFFLVHIESTEITFVSIEIL